jgi:DNA (cytosine-5)-methyltransferase 1
MENVPGMLSVEGVNVAHQASLELSTFAGGHPGYEVRYAPLDAAWYGAPQFRQRLIYIGLRNDLGIEPSMPPRRITAKTPVGYIKWHETGYQAEIFGGALRKDHSVPVPSATSLEPATTVRDALHDLPRITEHLSKEASTGRPSRDWRKILAYRSGLTPHAFGKLMRDWDGPESSRQAGVTAHFIRRTPRDFETFRRMEPGDRYPDAHRIANQRYEEERQEMEVRGQLGLGQLAELKKEIVPPYPLDGGFQDRWQKLFPDEPSWTVTAHLGHDTYSHIHYDSDQARAISVREAARLQTFPDRFYFGPEGGMKAAYSQVGNAVPPIMGVAVAKHVLTLLDET